MDNNLVERALKKAILHRKNSRFYKTLNGADVGDLYMSLIHTCELNQVNPFDYLTELQRHTDELAAKAVDWCPGITEWHLREPSQRLPDAGLCSFAETTQNSLIAASRIRSLKWVDSHSSRGSPRLEVVHGGKLKRGSTADNAGSLGDGPASLQSVCKRSQISFQLHRLLQASSVVRTIAELMD